MRKAQEAYSSLNSSECTKYASIKSAVPKAYKLVPEAYQQRFRTWRKGDKSHFEFACDLYTHFDRWRSATKVGSFETLRDSVILKQFKNSVPGLIAMYIGEHKVKTAAVILFRHMVGVNLGLAVTAGTETVPAGGARPFPSGRQSELQERYERDFCEADKICAYCHKREHWKCDCFVMRKKVVTVCAQCHP